VGLEGHNGAKKNIGTVKRENKQQVRIKGRVTTRSCDVAFAYKTTFLLSGGSYKQQNDGYEIDEK
jgi:hypothetical protein